MPLKTKGGAIPYPDSDYLWDRDRAKRLFEAWVSRLGLGFWKCDVEYHRTPLEPQGERLADATTVARCWCRWEYQTLTVEFCLPVIHNLSDDELEYAVVHELCHALVNEMREDDPDQKHEERVVTGLAKAFVWTLKSGRESKSRAKKASR